MRVAIATRIFEPEPSAASFRLAALASEFQDAGHEVEVMTVRPSRALAMNPAEPKYRVKRFPVLRDRTGYVRGYLQYLSFDVPLFFRILLGHRRELIVAEPPPTTGLFVRVACKLRRTPYAYYAADIWSDASESTGAPGFVVRAVRAIERFALNGALCVLSVNDGVTERVREIASRAVVHTIGNGVDTNVFTPDGVVRSSGQYLIYSGTASEWQGAGIFIDAFAEMLSTHPTARLVFLGQGSDWPALQERAAGLPAGTVEFIPTVPPEAAAEWIRGAAASLASIKPDSGYGFAFPTKVYASLACGTPIIYAGSGAVPDYLHEHENEARLGESTEYEIGAISAALDRALSKAPQSADREALGSWAAQRVSLSAVARKAVELIERRLQREP